MRLFLSFIIIVMLFSSCGKKSEPKYQGSISNFTKVI